MSKKLKYKLYTNKIDRLNNFIIYCKRHNIKYDYAYLKDDKIYVIYIEVVPEIMFELCHNKFEIVRWLS